VGLNGHKYNFQGEPGKVFALVSDKYVQINARFVNATAKRSKKGSTVIGDICVRYCDSRAVFGSDGMVKMVGGTSSNLIVHRHPNHTASVTAGYWTLQIESWGHGKERSFHNLQNIGLHHRVLAGPVHGVLGVSAPRIVHHVNGTTAKKHCQPNNEGGCEVPGEWHEYEVVGGLCSTQFKYSKFDSTQCANNASGFKRGQVEIVLMENAQNYILA